MADLLLRLNLGELAITSTPKTFLTAKAPTNQRLKLMGFELYGKGIAATDTPIKVELLKITTNGQTGNATAVTPVPNDFAYTETPQGTYYKNYTVEPTSYGVSIFTWEIHPQTGLMGYFPFHQEIKLPGGVEVGLRMTSNQNETLAANVLVEE